MTKDLLDKDTINSLREVGVMIGNENYFKTIYATFEDSFEKDLTEIQTQIASENFDRVQLLAHRMKSSARTIGAKALGEYFFVIEQQLKHEDTFTREGVQMNLDEAKQVYVETKRDIKDYL